MPSVQIWRRGLVACALILIAQGVDAASSLERAAERLAARTEHRIVAEVGRGSRGLLADLSTWSRDPLRAELQDEYLAAFSRRLRQSSRIDVRTAADDTEERRILAIEIERIARLPDREADAAFQALGERLAGTRYSFFVLPIERSDWQHVNLELRVVTAPGYSDLEVDRLRLPRSRVLGELFSVEVLVSQLEFDRESIVLEGAQSGTIEATRPRSADLSRTAIRIGTQTPEFRFDAAWITGDSFSSEESFLDGREESLALRLEAQFLSGSRVGGFGGIEREIVREEVTDNRFSFAPPLKGEYARTRARIGFIWGNLLNGVSFAFLAGEQEAEDVSEFFGGGIRMWDEDGTGFEVRARRTSERWSLDLRYLQLESDRSFNPEYFLGRTSAGIDTEGFRAEAIYRWASGIGVGIVYSHAAFTFVEEANAASERLGIDGQEDFIGLSLGWRWHPG